LFLDLDSTASSSLFFSEFLVADDSEFFVAHGCQQEQNASLTNSVFDSPIMEASRGNCVKLNVHASFISDLWWCYCQKQCMLCHLLHGEYIA
jgi:hypothetical protein